MNPLYVKPADANSMVRNPDRAFAQMPAAGDFVPDSVFWRRRLAAGDVVECEPPKAASTTAPATPAPPSTSTAA